MLWGFAVGPLESLWATEHEREQLNDPDQLWTAPVEVWGWNLMIPAPLYVTAVAITVTCGRTETRSSRMAPHVANGGLMSSISRDAALARNGNVLDGHLGDASVTAVIGLTGTSLKAVRKRCFLEEKRKLAMRTRRFHSGD